MRHAYLLDDTIDVDVDDAVDEDARACPTTLRLFIKVLKARRRYRDELGNPPREPRKPVEGLAHPFRTNAQQPAAEQPPAAAIGSAKSNRKTKFIKVKITGLF